MLEMEGNYQIVKGKRVLLLKLREKKYFSMERKVYEKYNLIYELCVCICV